MRKAIFLLLLALAFSFAATNTCTAGYEETAAVQVLDGNLRPIANATVQIVYQVDQTTGKGNTITAPRITDSNGMITIIFRNQEFVQERVDCTYTVIATYDNKRLEKKITVGTHPPVITMQLDVYRLNVNAEDQFGNVLSGAIITVRNSKVTADSEGKATILLGSGTVNVTLVYGQGSAARQIVIANDTDYLYQTGVYDLNVYVVDDQNTPLVADISIGDMSLQSDANGFASVKKLLTAKPLITSLYRGVKKETDADLAIQKDYYIVYDVHAPGITNLKARDEEGSIFLDMNVVDQGVRASGLAPDGIKVRYSFEGVEYYAPVYVKAKDGYEALIGSVDREGVVQLVIEAKDNEGNIRSVNAYFPVTYVNGSTGTGGNATGNQTSDNGQQQGEGFAIGPVHIIGVGVLIIIVLIGASYIRERLSAP